MKFARIFEYEKEQQIVVWVDDVSGDEPTCLRLLFHTSMFPELQMPDELLVVEIQDHEVTPKQLRGALGALTEEIVLSLMTEALGLYKTQNPQEGATVESAPTSKIVVGPTNV